MSEMAFMVVVGHARLDECIVYSILSSYDLLSTWVTASHVRGCSCSLRMYATVQMREAKEQHVRESELLSVELHELQQEMVHTCTLVRTNAHKHACTHTRLQA